MSHSHFHFLHQHKLSLSYIILPSSSIKRPLEKNNNPNTAMHSPCLKQVTQVCSNGCCSNPLFTLPPFTHPPTPTPTPTTTSTSSACRKHFTTTTTSSFFPNTRFTDHESLPSFKESLITFTQTYPKYSDTSRIDRIRAQEYYHLSLSNRICLDYIGVGLFSHLQLQSNSFQDSDHPFFNTIYKSVNLKTQLLHGGEGSEFESSIRNRIMEFMNVSGDDYSMVFTPNKSSAFKIVSEAYPFQTSRKLLMVYDYKSEAVDTMVTTSEKRGAKVMSAEFKWPRMRVHSARLRKMIERKRGKKKRARGLFVFPLQSRTTGASYSYQWMIKAQEHGWHVLLDACALGPKDMDSFGLSLIRPDFVICSLYKVFGENPSGFGCLFVKKSMISTLEDSCVGIATLVPVKNAPFQLDEEHSSDLELQRDDQSNDQRPGSSNQIVIHGENNKRSQIECRGLDHVDSLGLVQISTRTRCLINWLINALTKLEHPNTETKTPLVQIYGPRIRFDRGPALAFNIYDWKGEKIEPALVQKLSDRNNISLSQGCLQKIWFDDKYADEKERVMTDGDAKKAKGAHEIAVVTAAINFLANFEDVYRLWAFVARFLDADYVEKERWRYTALNQKTIEV